VDLVGRHRNLDDPGHRQFLQDGAVIGVVHTIVNAFSLEMAAEFA
jgi:hypothetical protein